MSQTYSFGDWRIPSPGSYTVLGPSQSGKSELLIKLLKNPSVWREKPSIVIYAAPTLEDRKDYLLRMKEACLKADGIPSPGSYTVLGPSQSGKSELLIKLLKNPSVWREKPSIVIYAAPTLEDRKDYLLRMKEACLKADGEKSEFMAMSQVPDEERVKQLINFRELPVILILDDLLSFPDKHHIKKAAQLGIKGCHHSKITLFMCLQNPFPQGYPEMVTLSRNTTGKFIMYQTNDLRSIRNISSSMFPDGKNFLLYCLFKAKQKLHCRYIFTNNHSRSDVDRRYLVYTCLFPSERPGKEPYHFDLD
jgi:thymidine kinase